VLSSIELVSFRSYGSKDHIIGGGMWYVNRLIGRTVLTPYSVLEVHKRFGGINCLHLQDISVNRM
jgi:hypothetical protein